MTALQLVVTNVYAKQDSISSAVQMLLDAKADINSEIGGGDTPLLAALQSHCVFGVEALCQHSAKVSPMCLEELRTISATKAREGVEDALQPLILRDKSLRCPLWLWVQTGNVIASEALLRNAAHDEEVNADVLLALQRCRISGALAELTKLLQDFCGEETFRRLEKQASTRRMLMELREAFHEEREPELDVICDALSKGADAQAQEEVEEEEDDNDEEDEDEEDEDNDEEDDGEGSEDEAEGSEENNEEEEDNVDDASPKALHYHEEDFAEDEPEGELDEDFFED